MKHPRRWFLPVFLMLGVGTASAQTLSPIPVRPRATSLVDGATIGAIGVLLVIAASGDGQFREESQEVEHRGGAAGVVADVGNAFGSSRYLFPALGATYLAGRLFKSGDVSRTAWHAGAAAAIAGTITLGLKLAVGRVRPRDGGAPGDFHPFRGGDGSFPSGHTAVAFAVATVIAQETTDRWTDLGLYGAASLTAFGRVHADAHWVSDVVAGAALGYLAGRWVTRRSHTGPFQIVAGPGVAGLSYQF